MVTMPKPIWPLAEKAYLVMSDGAKIRCDSIKQARDASVFCPGSKVDTNRPAGNLVATRLLDRLCGYPL